MMIEFDKPSSLLVWLEGKEEKYEIYITTMYRQIIAIPKISTRPIKMGIVTLSPDDISLKDIESKIKELMPKITINKVVSIDLRSER